MSAFSGVLQKFFSRALILSVVLTISSAVLMQSLRVLPANAYGLVTSRSIEMSDSNVNDSGVTYTVQFTPSGTTAIGGIVVDFCSNDPIIGDTCNPPTGLTVGGSSPSVSGYTNMGVAGNWTATGTNVFNSSYYRTLILTNTGTIATNSSTALSFNITSMTNPSAVGSFYARILTFDTAAHANAYSPTGTNTGLVDAGGIALSTANTITITAKVQETLTFCVATNSSPCTCASNCNNVTLGDNHGVLSTAGPYVDKSTYYSVATNANSGVSIRVKGATLTSGSNTITALTSPTTSSAGSSQFGICTYRSSGSTLAPVGNYDGNAGAGGTNCSSTSQTAGTGSPGGAGSAKWYLNTTNTGSTYGDAIASMGPDSANIGIIAMMANISSTTQAAIYTTTFTFIATGTY